MPGLFCAVLCRGKWKEKVSLPDVGARSYRRGLWIFLVLLNGIAAVWFQWPMQDDSDLGVYRMGGEALLNGLPLYEQVYGVLDLPFTYPPFAAVAFAPLTFFSFSVAGMLWTVLSLAALFRACVLVARHVANAGGDYGLGVLGLAALFELGMILADPFSQTLKLGQINFFLLWLVLEDHYGRVPDRFRGILTGIAAGIKLTPGIFVLFMLLRGDLRTGVRAAAAGLGTFVVGFIALPSDSRAYWTDVVFHAARVGPLEYPSNQSLYGTLYRLSSGNVDWPLRFGFVVVVAVLGMWAGRALWRQGYTMRALAVVSVTGLLLSPVSWSHHWVWLLVMLASLREGRRPVRALEWAALALLLAAWARLIWWSGGYGFSSALWDRVLNEAFVLAGLAWLGAAVVELASTRATRGEGSGRQLTQVSSD